MPDNSARPIIGTDLDPCKLSRIITDESTIEGSVLKEIRDEQFARLTFRQKVSYFRRNFSNESYGYGLLDQPSFFKQIYPIEINRVWRDSFRKRLFY